MVTKKLKAKKAATKKPAAKKAAVKKAALKKAAASKVRMFAPAAGLSKKAAPKKVVLKKHIPKKSANIKASVSPATKGYASASKADGHQSICDDKQAMDGLLQTLADTKQSVKTRQLALKRLQLATFSAIGFERYKPKYMATLRSVAKELKPLAHPDLKASNLVAGGSDLGRSVLAILAGYEDPMAQDLMVKGLDDPAKAVVPADTALQLLSASPHSGVVPAARRLAAESNVEQVRLQAMRVLGADAQSQPLLERVYQNKAEVPGVRQVAGAALRSVAPMRFQELARQTVLDDGESDALIAGGLTALRHTGNAKEMGRDLNLIKKVNALALNSTGKVKGIAAALSKKISIV